MVRTSLREWISPSPCAQTQIGWTSRNSSRRCLSANSCTALQFTIARLCDTKGSSNTSMRGKRPGVLPGRVQMMSATPSRAWS